MRWLVLITIGYLKPGENSGRRRLSSVQVLLGQTKTLHLRQRPPLVKSSLSYCQLGCISFYLWGHQDGTTGRAALL